jgi:catechol 2,3-dioxygenase-like lactoylglutathione lyase family enzyme
MHLHHLALRTSDVARLRAFYAGVLALPVVREADPNVWLGAGAALVMIEAAGADEPAPPPGSLELVAFAIGEHEKPSWRDRLAAHWIPIEAETAFTLYFRDPDGRRVAVSHYPLPADAVDF